MKILLDPGHGGRDPGAVGVLVAGSELGAEVGQRLQEKDVTLTVAGMAATILRELGYTVLLTREADVDVPLQARTGMALGGAGRRLHQYSCQCRWRDGQRSLVPGW